MDTVELIVLQVQLCGEVYLSLWSFWIHSASESWRMKSNKGTTWHRFNTEKKKSAWKWTSWMSSIEPSQYSQEGVALVQLEDFTNVSLVGKSKSDLRSPFRSDLSPISSNSFHIDTALQPSLIIPLSSTNKDKGGLIGGCVHILRLHLISLHPSAAFLWWPSPSCKCNQSNSIWHAK